MIWTFQNWFFSLLFISLINCSACHLPITTQGVATESKTQPLKANLQNLKGVYAIKPQKNEIPEYVFKSSDIDGIFLKYTWAELEPKPGIYNWTNLDEEFEKTITHHKKVELGISAGANSPEWLEHLGVPFASFTEATRNFFGNCETYRLPTFWNPTFITRWQLFLKALHQHLEQKPEYLNAITMVKMFGINSQSDEIKLPQQEDVIKNDCKTSNQATLWSKLGYRPSHLIQTWLTNAAIVDKLFPHAFLGMAMVMPNTSFPNVDEQGKVVQGLSAATHQHLLDAAFNQFLGRLVVNSTALREDGGTPPFVREAKKNGAIIGFQLYGKFIHPACAKHCNQTELTHAFDRGLSQGASFFEVFVKTLTSYPKAIKHVHQQLSVSKE